MGREKGNGKAERAERASQRDNGNRGNRDVARGGRQDRGKPAKDERDHRPARDASTASDASERYDDRRGDQGDAARRDRYEERRAPVRYSDRRDNYEGRRYRDDERPGDRYRSIARDRDHRAIDGCPPGLAKKNNGCLPPGLARNRDRTIFGHDYRPRYFGLTNYRDDRYQYNNGYLVRYGDNDRISGWIPLLGGALAVGNAWPQRYESYELPDYYVDYYDLGGADRYRYADNVIYRVGAGDAAITSIAALLTGDQFVVGQRMPRGYDVYNVPYGYRDRYYDSPDAMYRYSDGQIYQMDPTTQLVQAVISLLV